MPTRPPPHPTPRFPGLGGGPIGKLDKLLPPPPSRPPARALPDPEVPRCAGTCACDRGVPAAPEPEPEEPLGLGQLPTELLEMVLSHVPPHVLLGRCRRVCRRWHDLVDCQALWLSILAWKHAALWPIVSTCLPPADDPRPCVLGRFCERRPIGRNLLRNPRGEAGWNEEALTVNHVFSNFKKGVRFVSCEHWVQDMEFLSEHYGVYLPNSSVIVRVRLS
ncbi:F-box only protein 27-like [Mesoplodon densirostris]|uniref:F-box only protein 27-like n=1 Tax=Mesoplodon densirostris TaxID=48708 RepID=UPI0028DB6FB4|nr:F-box only protein 27-like [Mesoplodon densirostris]